MECNRIRRSILGSIPIGLGILCIGTLSCLFAFVSMTLTVSGTASLPNGVTAVINRPFSCSANGPTTEIEAGGHICAFGPTIISVDGLPVGPLDSSITDVQIDARFWTASLRVNGSEVKSTH